MALPLILNRVKMTTATTGTGTITLGSASASFMTMAEAGATDGYTYSYLLEDGNDFEIGYGVYTASGTTFTRATVVVSKISGTAGTSKISLSGSALFSIVFTAAIEAAIPQFNCGRLSFVSTTAIKFIPFDGDTIRIAGITYQIPSAGIAGVANTSVFVNGSGSSNLGASTLYYVYCFNNAGTLTADFSTTAYAVSATAGNVGTYIKSGDETRTLIGMIRTNGSSQFADGATQRFVRSWFNDPGIAGTNNLTTGRTTTSTSSVELNSEIRVEFISWTGEIIQAQGSGICSNSLSSAGNETRTGLGFDGTTFEDTVSIGVNTVNSYAVCIGMALNKTGLAEGYHYMTLLGYVNNAGTGNWNGSGTAGTRCTITLSARR